jgi:hypothetical protein
MWPIALPQTKVVHLLRLAWETVVVTVNQNKSRQGNAVIQSGCKSQRYQAYRLRIQSTSKATRSKGWIQINCGIKRIGCVSKANTSKGWKRLDGSIKRISCVSAAYPKQIRQRDGNGSTAVSSVSAAYPNGIHSA